MNLFIEDLLILFKLLMNFLIDFHLDFGLCFFSNRLLNLMSFWRRLRLRLWFSSGLSFFFSFLGASFSIGTLFGFRLTFWLLLGWSLWGWGCFLLSRFLCTFFIYNVIIFINIALKIWRLFFLLMISSSFLFKFMLIITREIFDIPATNYFKFFHKISVIILLVRRLIIIIYYLILSNHADFGFWYLTLIFKLLMLLRVTFWATRCSLGRTALLWHGKSL